MRHFKSLGELHRINNFPPPENPLISLFRCDKNVVLIENEFTSDFYMIAFKKLKSGIFMYGKTTYDYEGGSLFFVKPGQLIELKDLECEEVGLILYIHENYLQGSALYSEIKKYGFFEYEANEALHLSPKEEDIMLDLYNKISLEYYNNQDEYSKDIILSHIESILKYAQRFYKRQFINRKEISGKFVTKFNEALSDYFMSEKNNGLPSVNAISTQLKISPRYLSDMLKLETGKTAIELIHIYLINEAKNLIQTNDLRISEIAYQLGFDNLSYFSRLFKKEVGVRPIDFRRKLLN